MGTKLEAVKKAADNATKEYGSAKKLGADALRDTKEMKRLIDSLPTDVDDEIVSAAKAVEQGTKADAETYMKSEVKASLDAGHEKMRESSDAAKDQAKKNEKVQAVFAQMDSVGGFGKGARAEGRSKVESSTKEFNKVAAENAEKTKEAEEDFKKNLSDISGTF